MSVWEDIERVLAQHEIGFAGKCSCGWEPDRNTDWNLHPPTAQHRTHVAAILREHVDAVVAKALAEPHECEGQRQLAALAQVVADNPTPAALNEARAEGWDAGKKAMAHARLMQGGDDPQNPYRTRVSDG